MIPDDQRRKTALIMSKFVYTLYIRLKPILIFVGMTISCTS